MDLIEEYLKAVAVLLPRSQRDGDGFQVLLDQVHGRHP